MKTSAFFTTIDGKVTAGEVDITTSEPPPLSPEQIVRNEVQSPWIRRLTASRMDITHGEEGAFQGKGIARLAIRYDGRMHRTVADIMIEGVVDRDNNIISSKISINKDYDGEMDEELKIVPTEEDSFRLYLRAQLEAKFISELKYEGDKKK